MQPPYTQPLQVKGQPVIDPSSENPPPPGVSSPGKAKHFKQGNVRTAASHHAHARPRSSEAASFPVDARLEANFIRGAPSSHNTASRLSSVEHFGSDIPDQRQRAISQLPASGNSVESAPNWQPVSRLPTNNSLNRSLNKQTALHSATEDFPQGTVNQHAISRHSSQNFASLQIPSTPSLSTSPKRGSPNSKATLIDDGKRYKPSSPYFVPRGFQTTADPKLSAQAKDTLTKQSVTSHGKSPVPVTRQLFVSIPSAPVSCPPASPLTRLSAPMSASSGGGDGDDGARGGDGGDGEGGGGDATASPSKNRVFFDFDNMDAEDLSEIFRRIAEAAERRAEETNEMISPIKLQDPPRSKSSRKLSPNQGIDRLKGNPRKNCSPSKNNLTDLSGNFLSAETFPRSVMRPKTREHYELKYTPEANACQVKNENPKFGESGNSPRPGSVRIPLTAMDPLELKSKSSLIISPRKDPNASIRLPSSSSNRNHPLSKKSREKGASPYYVRRTKQETVDNSLREGQPHLKGNAHDSRSNCRVPTVHNGARQSIAINPTSTANVSVGKVPHDHQTLRSDEGHLNGRVLPQKGAPRSYAYSPSKGKDEVDGMETYMECDDDSGSYDPRLSTSFSSPAHHLTDYRRGQTGLRNYIQSSNFSSASYEQSLNPSRSFSSGDSHKTAWNFVRDHETLTDHTNREYSSNATSRLHTSTPSRHNTSHHGTARLMYNDTHSQMRINQHFSDRQQRFPAAFDQRSATTNVYTTQRNITSSDVEYSGRDRGDVSFTHTRVPYRIDPRGRVVVESEQVEDNSTDVVACFSSDEDSPTNRFSRNSRGGNSNMAAYSPQDFHVVTTRADTNVHYIHPLELSDSSSMSCDDGSGPSDDSNTSLPCGDCGPQSRFSRSYFGGYDETDGSGNNYASKLDIMEQVTHSKEITSTRASDNLCQFDTSATVTSCKAISNDFAAFQTEQKSNFAMRAKSRSSDSIFYHNVDVDKPKSEFIRHDTNMQRTSQDFFLNPEICHSPLKARSSQDLSYSHNENVTSNNISRTKAFENLTKLPPKLVVEHKRFTPRPQREKRTGSVSSRVHRRKQKREIFEKEKRLLSLPRQTTFQRHSTQSHSLEDLIRSENYELNSYDESDGDGLDEVDGLGDDATKQTPVTQSSTFHTQNVSISDDADNIVHCFDEPSNATKGKDSDIVSCFDEYDGGGGGDSDKNDLTKVRRGNNRSHDFSGGVDDGGNHSHNVDLGDKVVHCFSDNPDLGSTQKSYHASYESLDTKRDMDDEYSLLSNMRHRSNTENSISLTKTQIDTDEHQQHGGEVCRGGKSPNKSLFIPRGAQRNVHDKDITCRQPSSSSNDVSSATLYSPSNFGDSQRESSKSMPDMTFASDEIDLQLMEYQNAYTPQELGKMTPKSPTAMRTKSPSKMSSRRLARRRGSKDVDKLLAPQDSISRRIDYHRSLSSDPIHSRRISNSTSSVISRGRSEATSRQECFSSNVKTIEGLEYKSICITTPIERNKHLSSKDVESLKSTPQRQKNSPKLHRPWLSSPPKTELSNDPSVMSGTDTFCHSGNGLTSSTVHSAGASSFITVNLASSHESTAQEGHVRLSRDAYVQTPLFYSGMTTQRDLSMPYAESATLDVNPRSVANATTIMTRQRETREPKWDKRKSDGDASHQLLSSASSIERFGSEVQQWASKLSDQCDSENQSENYGNSSPSRAQCLSSSGNRHPNAIDQASAKRHYTSTPGSLSLWNTGPSNKRSARTKLDFGHASVVSHPSAGTPTRLADHDYDTQLEGHQAQVVDQSSERDGGDAGTSSARLQNGSECGETSGFQSANIRKRQPTEGDKDEIDVKIQVTDVMAETRNLGQRLEDIYQSNRGDCDCARVEREVLQTALDIFGKLCAAPETQANFIEELRKTNETITDALEVAASLRMLCRHGRRVTDVRPGSIILRLKCKTLMAVLDLCYLHKTGELQALLFVILRMRHRDLAPGLTLKVTINEDNVRTCIAFISSKVSILMTSRLTTVQKDKKSKKRSPTKRVARSTENLLSSPHSPASPKSVHERWKSTPVLSSRSPLTSPMYINSPTYPVYVRERKFSFGDATRNAFQELNISDTDSPSSSVKEEMASYRHDVAMRRLFSPSTQMMTSPGWNSPPPTSPLTSSAMRLKRCDVIQEQENIGAHGSNRTDDVYDDRDHQSFF